MNREQYTKLARRTLPTGLTRRELLSMLVLGALGEVKELEEIDAQDPDTHPFRRQDLIDEVGDCYWYLSILWDELGNKDMVRQDYDRAEISIAVEIAKKVIYHGDDEERLRRLVIALWTQVGNCSYHNDLPGPGEIRKANIAKLKARYPDGFVLGGGNR